MPAFSITGTGGIPGSNIIGAVGSATYAATSGTAGYAPYAANATNATNSSNATNAVNAINATYAATSGTSSSAIASQSILTNGGNLIFSGESIEIGNGGILPFPSLLSSLPAWDSRLKIVNTAVSGQTLANMIANYSTQVHPYTLAVSGTPGIVAPTTNNDYSVISGSGLAYYETQYNSYIASVHADGDKFIAVADYAKTNISSYESLRTQKNAWLASGTAGGCQADGFFDPSVIMEDENNQTYYQPDGVHPSLIGAFQIAQLFRNCLLSGGYMAPNPLQSGTNVIIAAPNGALIVNGTFSLNGKINTPISMSGENYFYNYDTGAANQAGLYAAQGMVEEVFSLDGGSVQLGTLNGSSFTSDLTASTSGVVIPASLSGSSGAQINLVNGWSIPTQKYCYLYNTGSGNQSGFYQESSNSLHVFTLNGTPNSVKLGSENGTAFTTYFIASDTGCAISGTGAGTVTLASGVGMITNATLSTTSAVLLSVKASSGTLGTYAPEVIVYSGSAAVTGAATDNSTYNYRIIQ
jgi:hypothetical protein